MKKIISYNGEIILYISLLISSFIGEILFVCYRLYETGHKYNREVPIYEVIQEGLIELPITGIHYLCYMLIGICFYHYYKSKYWPIIMIIGLVLIGIIDLSLDYLLLRMLVYYDFLNSGKLS